MTTANIIDLDISKQTPQKLKRMAAQYGVARQGKESWCKAFTRAKEAAVQTFSVSKMPVAPTVATDDHSNLATRDNTCKLDAPPSDVLVWLAGLWYSFLYQWPSSEAQERAQEMLSRCIAAYEFMLPLGIWIRDKWKDAVLPKLKVTWTFSKVHGPKVAKWLILLSTFIVILVKVIIVQLVRGGRYLFNKREDILGWLLDRYKQVASFLNILLKQAFSAQ